MAKPKFNWDATALVRETLEVELAGEIVTFHELTKARCDKFIAEAQSALTKLFEEYDETYVDPDTGAEKTRKAHRHIPVESCSKQQTELINKWLAECTATFDTATKTWVVAQNSEFFDIVCEEFISQYAYGCLIEAVLFDLQHINDILAVRGNYLRLPEILELARVEAAAAKTN